LGAVEWFFALGLVIRKGDFVSIFLGLLSIHLVQIRSLSPVKENLRPASLIITKSGNIVKLPVLVTLSLLMRPSKVLHLWHD
jgi:hypothetical protein